MSQPPSGHLSPSEITGKSFDTKRRGGFDPESVKQHLAAVAATVKGLTDERSGLLDQLTRLKDQLAHVTDTGSSASELDEDALTERLGQDAARVLAEARSAAADRIAEAEAQADDIRAAAEEVFAERSVLADEEASRIREGAEQLVAERRVEAEQAASQIIARAEADAEMTRTSVSGEQQAADADAARIIREAELTRRQILEDLARRRSAARRQIEQLRAGRERLLASHETVRRALDDISEELTISMSEARAAAETAGHNVSETTIEELEAEIETARLTGLLDTGPVPVVPTKPVDPPRAPLAPTRFAPSPETEVEEDSTPQTRADDPSPGSTEAVTPVEPSSTEASGDVHDPAPKSATPDSGAASQKAGLAEVVQLDRARNEVDTATHPATGRDASSGRGTGGTTQEQKPPRLEAVPSKSSTPEAKSERDDASAPAAEAELDDSVGDLFASLRSSKAEPAAKKPAKKSTAKKTTARKSTSKKGSSKSAAKKSAAATKDDVDSSELTRRLKRVLADEQSRAMSTLKSAAGMPQLDDLLGVEAVHGDVYWAEVVGHLTTATSSDTDLRAPVDELVSSIRRRVGAALDDADDDSEVAVGSLRNIYREIKTQRVGSCADSVCRMAAGRSADRS